MNIGMFLEGKTTLGKGERGKFFLPAPCLPRAWDLGAWSFGAGRCCSEGVTAILVGADSHIRIWALWDLSSLIILLSGITTQWSGPTWLKLGGSMVSKRLCYASSLCIYPKSKQLKTNVNWKESDVWTAEISEVCSLLLLWNFSYAVCLVMYQIAEVCSLMLPEL